MDLLCPLTAQIKQSDESIRKTTNSKVYACVLVRVCSIACACQVRACVLVRVCSIVLQKCFGLQRENDLRWHVQLYTSVSGNGSVDIDGLAITLWRRTRASAGMDGSADLACACPEAAADQPVRWARVATGWLRAGGMLAAC